MCDGECVICGFDYDYGYVGVGDAVVDDGTGDGIAHGDGGDDAAHHCNSDVDDVADDVYDHHGPRK
eukprot:2447608-Pyramimonas_sp.AAC.1